MHEEGGSAVTFSLVSGTYQAPSFVLATLVQNGDGSFTFTRERSRQQFVFTAPTIGSPGQLSKEIDKNGDSTALAHYSSGPRYQLGKLATVTDPAGRALTFVYTSAGRIDHLDHQRGPTDVGRGDDHRSQRPSDEQQL